MGNTDFTIKSVWTTFKKSEIFETNRRSSTKLLLTIFAEALNMIIEIYNFGLREGLFNHRS